MTELFGRLAPGADVETARADLAPRMARSCASIPRPTRAKADFRIDAVQLRDQITAPARTVLLILLAASALVFVIACSNVANLILARSVRREGELAVRAALGARTERASPHAAGREPVAVRQRVPRSAWSWRGRWWRCCRNTPRDSPCARSMSRWMRACSGLASASRWSQRCCSHSCRGCRRRKRRAASASSNGSVRLTTGTNRRLRVFAVTQIAASFVLLAGAGMLLTTLLALQTAQHRLQHEQRARVATCRSSPDGASPSRTSPSTSEAMRRIGELPGVERVAVGTLVPWREAGCFGPGFQFTVEGYAKADGEEDPRARFRTVSPGFFAALGVPIIAGRDFNDGDRRDAEKVVIVSQSLAQRMFPSQDAVNRHIMWTDPVMKFIDVSTEPRRIVGVVADVDDENVVPGPAMTVYHPMRSGDRRRPAVRPRAHRSVRAGPADHAHHPRAVGRSAGREGRDAGRCARRGAGAESAERARVRRLRRRRAADCRRRRRWRAGVLGERAHARVRHPARDRIGADGIC